MASKIFVDTSSGISPMPDLIFDTTVLSNFAAANRMDLLKAEYQSAAFTTIEIQDEPRNGSNAGYDYLKHAIRQIQTIHSDGWIRLLFVMFLYSDCGGFSPRMENK